MLRKQLCKIHNRQYIERPDGGRVHVRFMLTADKSGLCHMLGRRNMNYDAYGTQCDCKDSLDTLYDLTLGALTHFDGLTFEKRSARAHVAEWETREQPRAHTTRAHTHVHAPRRIFYAFP